MYQNFEGIYQNLINQIGKLAQEKEEYRIKMKRVYVIFIAIVIIFLLIGGLYFHGIIVDDSQLKLILIIASIVSVIVLIIAVVKAVNVSDKFNNIFKKQVLPQMILNIDENLNYKPKQGLSEKQYKDSGIAIEFNSFKSEDYISGFFADNALLEMSEINAQFITVDKDGITNVIDSFNGILVVATLKKTINNKIKIVKNSIWKLDRKANIRIASLEFEKYFDVYADDKVQAMQIFTSDIIDKILYFAQELKIKVQISIKDNKFYMTFETGEMYEGGITKNTKDLLSRYYLVTSFIVDIVKKINKSIEEIVL